MRRFLISRLSALGDVVCSLPAAVALKEGHPGCNVTWVVDPRFAGIVECCGAVDEIVLASPKLSPASWLKVKGTFDAALDLQGLFKSGIIVARANAKRKVGYHWQREGSWLFSRAVSPDPSSVHIVDQYVDVAEVVGGKLGQMTFALTPKSDDVEAMGSLVGETNRLIIVNPGAGWASKRWPPEHFAALIDNLAKEGTESALIGSKSVEDREIASDVLRACATTPIDLVGKTSVRELVALISLASAHVGGDTGSTHIAAAHGVPAIGLYSITKPERSCPYGQLERCHYDPDSLANIQPSDVAKTVMAALA